MSVVSIGGGQSSKAIEVALDRARNQNVILIPSACSSKEKFDKRVRSFRKIFAKFGVVEVPVLHDYEATPSKDRVEHLLGNAGLAFVIGGNTPLMLKTLDSHGSDKVIQKENKNGLVLAGKSAGAILPFAFGQSNPVSNPEEVEWSFQYIAALGIIDATVGVHSDLHDPINGNVQNEPRFENFKRNALNYTNNAVSIEDGAAIVIDESGTQITSTKDGAAAHFININESGNLNIVTLHDKEKTHLIKKQ